MGVFKYPLAATRGLALLLAEVDPQRRMRAASKIIFRDPAGYSEAERRGLTPEEYARQLYDGRR